MLDLQEVCRGVPPAWFDNLRDWDRMLRSGNYPETTRYGYLLAGAQLSRFLADNAERLARRMRRRSDRGRARAHRGVPGVDGADPLSINSPKTAQTLIPILVRRHREDPRHV